MAAPENRDRLRNRGQMPGMNPTFKPGYGQPPTEAAGNTPAPSPPTPAAQATDQNPEVLAQTLAAMPDAEREAALNALRADQTDLYNAVCAAWPEEVAGDESAEDGADLSALANAANDAKEEVVEVAQVEATAEGAPEQAAIDGDQLAEPVAAQEGGGVFPTER